METVLNNNLKANIGYAPEQKEVQSDRNNYFSYLNEQRVAAVKSSFLDTMNIKAPQERNWAYAYRASKWAYDNINYLYRNEDDPRETLSKDVVGNMLHNVFPNIPLDVAKQNARDIVKTFTGDDMSCTNVLDLAKTKVSEGLVGLGVGFQNLAYIFKYGNESGDPEIIEQRHKDQLAMINAKMSGLKRTDYYNKDFDSFIDKVVLSAADFIPSEIASIVPEVLGGTLAVLTGNPLLFLAGRVVGGTLAGVMEAGSASVELARAGADFGTQQLGSILVGLVNGTLEYVGNVAEAKTVESIFNLRRLNKAVGKNQIAKLTARQIKDKIGKQTVKGFMGHLAKEYAGNLVFEPLTEGAQEFVSMYVMNLASEWQAQNTGKSFTEEFTSTPQELANGVWETIQSTFRGQLLLGLAGGVVDTISNLGPHYKEGGFGHWKFEAGQLMQAIQTNKLQNHGSNSIFIDSNNVLINDNTKAYKPPVETKNGKETVGKVDSVKMANINGILTPVNAEEMSKAAYMQKNSKFGMYIDIQEQNESTKERATKSEAEALVGKLEKGKNPIYVSESGEIQVNYQDIDKTILDVMKQLGDDYSGIFQGKGFVTIDSKDKQYTITSSIGEGSREVTWRTLYDAMKADEGTKIGIDRATFKDNLKKEFTRLGVKDADTNAEYMSQWVDKYTPVFDELGKKLLVKVKTDEDIDGLKYGTAAMISRFMPIAGYDGAWAKDHIVIDTEIGNGTSKKFVKDYGYSYWTDGESDKHYKDISDVPNRENAVFHISLTDIADQTTGIHEVGHMALSLCADKFISDEYFKKAFAKELEKDNRTGQNKDGSYIHRPDEEWRIGDATHEAFAVGLENYINTGVAQNKEMEGLFRKVLNAVKAFWDQFKNKLSPEQQDFYDRMFGVIEDEEEKSENFSEESNAEESDNYYDDTSELERQGEEWWAAHEDEFDRHKMPYTGDRFKREYEVNGFNEEMRNGEMVPFYTLDKYRTESEWVDAEKTALRTVSDGSLNWMTFLLRRIITEMKGENFSTSDITDNDWNRIADAFVANAKERIKSENRSRTKKDVEVFEGKDVPKVLIRLLAWDMNTSEQEKISNWVNKFTGRNGKWNDHEILELARRMNDRGEFNDKKRYSDGTEASEKYRFLDMVYQTAKKQENFRYTRVGEAYYEGAIMEIESNARELMEIDQTYAPLKKTDGNAVEDVELDFTNVTERDVNKARKEAEQYREQARQAEEEYEKLDNEATILRANVIAMLDELQETAKSIGINPEEYKTIVGLAQAIKEKGGKISDDNVKLAETNQDILSKYEARLSDLKEEIKVYKKDYASLEIENRRHARDAEKYSKKLSELADKYRGLQLSEKNKENFNKIKTELENMIDKFNDLRMEDDDIKKKYKAAKRELREAWKLADQYSKKNEKLEKKNDKLLNEKLLDEAVIKQLDINFAEVLNALEDAIKRKERAQRALWNRNNEMRELRERNLISNSRRKWRKLLESKGGDATQDKALAFFAKAFFRSEVDGQFIPTKFDSETMNSIANIAQFLQDKGLMKDNTLIKGFSDLKLADYKAMYSAIEADKYNSRFAKEEREKKMKADVQFISSESRDEMGAMTLTKKEKQEAKTAWLKGEYDTQEEAEKAFYQKKLDTTHGGTKAVRDAKKKMGYNTRKGLNPNNNFLFNSFTSMFNLMGSMSKKFRDFFYFGNAETNTKGINQVTDDYITRRQRRRDFVTDELIRILGDKKEVEKFLKETQKNVEIRMVDFNEIPSWLMNQQTFRNYLGILEESDDSNMLFETEKKEPKVQFDKNYADSTLTLEEVMAIYEHAKQDEDLAHILSRNGNNINPLAVAYIVNQFENPDGKFNKYKEIADTYQKAYELSWDDFKRVANDIYDIALTRYEYYSPARSVDRDTDLMVGYNFDINGIPHEKGKKLTQKERADMQLKLGGDNAIKLSYVTDYNSIADSQEWFIAGAEFFKMWNDIMKNDGGGMRKHIDETFGSRASDTLIKNMRAISGSVFDDIADNMNSFMSRIRNNMAYANLGFSVSSALQQPSVLAFATSEFGAKNMRDAFSTIAEKGGINDFIKYVHENSPQIMAIRDANLSYADRAVEDSKFLKAIGVGQDIAKWGLKGMRALDQFSRCVTWEAGYRYYLEQRFSDEQAKLRATQACLNINTSTQAKDNALLYNSKNPLWKGLLMFTNQLNKNWNLLIGEKGFGAIKEKNVAQFIATMCAYGVSTSMILIAKGKFFHNNEDEDKEWWEDLWKDYLSQGITVVPVIGDKISKAINGYSYLDSDIINSGYNFIKRTAQVLEDGSDKNKKKVITATKNFLMDAMELSGSPKLLTKNMYRTLFDDGRFVGDEFFTGWRWTGLLAPSEWFEVITGKEL